MTPALEKLPFSWWCFFSPYFSPMPLFEGRAADAHRRPAPRLLIRGCSEKAPAAKPFVLGFSLYSCPPFPPPKTPLYWHGVERTHERKESPPQKRPFTALVSSSLPPLLAIEKQPRPRGDPPPISKRLAIDLGDHFLFFIEKVSSTPLDSSFPYSAVLRVVVCFCER